MQTATGKKPGTPKDQRLLTNEVKQFIVREHARFRRPKHIVEAVKEVFGVEVSYLQVLRYNPENAVAVMSEKLREYFREERAKYVQQLEEVPAYHQRYRLDTLLRLAHKAEDEGNKALAAQIFEQIAKEVGGFYSNKRQVDIGGGDKPVELDVRQSLKGIPEETLLELAELANRMTEGR